MKPPRAVFALSICQKATICYPFNGFGFDLRPYASHGPAPLLCREVMRDVFGLVGREQGRSAQGRGNESKKTYIVTVIVIETNSK